MIKLLLMYSNHAPTAAHIERLSRLSPDVRVVVADSEERAVREAPDADIILGHRYLRQTLPHATRLKWIQSTAGGPHHLVSSRLLHIAPLITRCPIFSDVVAFHMFATALALLRRIPDAARGQEPAITENMQDMPRRAMILGVGSIGKELAKILKRNGIYTIGAVKAIADELYEYCDEQAGVETWKNMLYSADALFVAVPPTAENNSIISDDVIGGLPRHAAIVSVSRTSVIDIEALQAHLEKGHLCGAAIDDKIDSDNCKLKSPLLNTPRLLITPKVATFIPGRIDRLEKFLEEQLCRYVNGRQLLFPFNYGRP